MNAADVMTDRIIEVSPQVTVRECAQILLRHRISAVPVVDDDNKLIGMVSEGDLVHRVELGTQTRPHSWWLGLLTGKDELARDYTKSHAKLVRDVMTRDVVTVGPDASLREIACTLEEKHIKRVPVVADGRVIGIVSRANLLHALAGPKGYEAPVSLADRATRTRIVETLRNEPWSSLLPSNITVTEGIAELWGTLASEEERRASVVAVENDPGVQEVIDHRVLITKIPYGAV